MKCTDIYLQNATVLKDGVSYLIFNRMQNVFQILSGKNGCFAPRLQANDLSEATGFVSEKKEVASEVRDRSAAVNGALQYGTYSAPATR